MPPGVSYAAALHAHQAVLDQVGYANAVARADLVELFDYLDRAIGHAVYLLGYALLEVYLDVFGLIGGIFGALAYQAQILRRLVPRILQVGALVGDVPEVAVHRVGALLGDRHVQTARLGVIDLLFAGLNVPYAPGSDYLHVGCERLYRQLKAHLIVALAGCAVADRRGAFLFGNLDEALGYHGPGKAGAQQVFALVHRAHLQRGPDAVGHELLAHVLYVYLASAGLYRLFVQRREFLALTHVHRHRDDFAIVVFLEPRYYYRRIQTARIREHDLFLSHCDIPPVICLRAPYGVACPSAHKEYTTSCIKIQ